MLPKPRLNVQNFPRPPLLEKTSRHLVIRYRGQTIAETSDAYWVLETYHSPTYYLPATSLSPKFPLTPTNKSTFCEYKGWATYYSISLPAPFSPSPVSSCPFEDQLKSSEPRKHEIPNRIWSYESPTPQYADLKGYLSFYAGPWDCYVDGEQVIPQPGDFYGGWTTSELDGIIKGSAETRWM